MTPLVCLRLTHLKGFFWGDRFYTYGRRWSPRSGRCGWGPYQRTLGLRLLNGARPKGAKTYRIEGAPYDYGRMYNIGLVSLRLNVAHVPKTRPWGWVVSRYLLTRSYRGSRYKLGLPARGQRTHSNASTTGRVRDAAALFVRRSRIVPRVWEARKANRFVPRSLHKRKGPKGAKAKAGPVVRSKKKVDVWK
jgi:hypothetical protein